MSKTDLPALSQSHGHVRPRPDGVKARCGGPAICRVCQREQAALSTPAAQEAETLEPAMLTALRLAWAGQHDKAANYVELAAQRLEKDGETSKARWLRTALAEMQGEQEPTMIHALGAAQEVRQEPVAWLETDHEGKIIGVTLKPDGTWPTAPLYAAPQPPQPVALTPRHGAVFVNGALVCCEEFDREPCPHDPARRCKACPGGITGEAR